MEFTIILHTGKSNINTGLDKDTIPNAIFTTIIVSVENKCLCINAKAVINKAVVFI